MPSLDYQKVKNAEFIKVVLALPNGAVQGYAVNDFDISGANQFANFFGDPAILRSLRDVARTGTELAGGTPYKIEHFGLSKFSWLSSSRFKCTLNLLFIEADLQDNTILHTKELLNTVFPSESGLRIIPPLEYGIQDGGILSGLPKNGIAIQIGTWFKTDPVFVVEQLALKLSKIPTDTGRPLWMTASLSLSSFRMNNVDEVKSWFLG